MAVILVVEDETDLCNVIRTHLEAEGHTVYQAFDGPSALAAIEGQAPELVVLDMIRALARRKPPSLEGVR